MDTYSGSASEAAQISDGSCSTAAHYLIHAESKRVPPDLWSSSTRGQGWWRQWAVINCEKRRGLAPEAASEWSLRHLHRQCIRPLSAHGPHLFQHSPRLWQRSQCGESENHTLETEPARVKPLGLLLQQLD